MDLLLDLLENPGAYYWKWLAILFAVLAVCPIVLIARGTIP